MNKNKKQDYSATALFNPKIIEISEESFISIQLYEFRSNKFYDVILYNNGIKQFVGRFDEKDSIFEVAYNNGKILVYYSEFDEQSKKMCVSEIAQLYDISDDTVYACTEELALKLFDDNMDSQTLKNKDNSVIRIDKEKRKRLIKSNGTL